MKTKIILYSHYFWPSMGGVETFNLQLLDELKNHYNISVITKTLINDDITDDKFEFNIDRKTKLSIKNRPDVDLIIISGYSIKMIIYSWIWKIPSIVIHHGDIINCSNGTGLHQNNLCNHRKIKCFKYDLREFGIIKSLKMQANLFIKKLISKLPSKHVFVSKWVKDITKLNGEVIYNCFDKSFIENDSIKKENQIIFAGRLTKIKGCEFLIDAYFKANISMQLIICGEGEEKNKLLKKVEELSLEDKIIFKGALSKETLSKEMQRSKFCVIPTIIEESFGLVAIESAASNCIVIGSGRGGLLEVCNKLGYSYQTKEELIDLLKKAEKNLLENRSAKVEYFNSKKMYSQYIDLIENLISKNK